MTRTRMTRRRGRALFGSALWAALLLSGCGGDTEDETAETPEAGETAETTEDDDGDETRTFEADNGDIEIPTDPQNIVTIGSAGLFLDLGVEPVGMSPKGDNSTDNGLQWLAPEAEQVNEAAVDLGAGAELDYEETANLEPDLIVIHVPAHAWEDGNFDEERLQSIAPTVWIEIKNEDWKTQSERLADVVGEIDAFEEDGASYEALITEIQDEYAEILDSTTFAVLNQWGGGFEGADGTIARENPTGYCTTYAAEAGLDIQPEEPEEEGPSTELSMERLGDVAEDVDVLIYPLGADGEVKPEFEPVIETNIWESLPQAGDDRALGVQCNTISSYSSKVVSLESLKEALGTLSEAG